MQNIWFVINLRPKHKPKSMDRFIKSINEQLKSSRDKNIFADTSELFQFIDETINAIAQINEIDRDTESFLIDYATDKAIEEFCRVNQYYSFSSQTRNELREIYVELFSSIREQQKSIEEISKNHYTNIQSWIKNSNPFAEKIYSPSDELINPVPCSEYNADLQIEILGIEITKLIEPVLDIGCGSKGTLVNFLRGRGIEAYGIDRYKFANPHLSTADWLEYKYEANKWGTITSNLGFSNHFNHHNLREDGNYIQYGKVYMNILNSLKRGGSFHYAPDLPFIEKYLDANKFVVRKNEIKNYNFKTSVIQKMD